MDARDVRQWWQTQCSRLAGWLGESTPDDASRVPDDRLTQWPDTTPLADVLPYQSYDPETGLFMNKGSAGFMLEALPLLGAGDETGTILASLMTDVLPDGMDIQVTLWASPQIGPVLDAFESVRSQRGGVYAWLNARRRDYLARGRYESLARSGAVRLRHFRVFWTLSQPVKSLDESTTQKLVQTRDDIMSSLSSLGMPSRPVNAEGLLSVVDAWLNPAWDLQPAHYHWHAHEALARQLTNPECHHAVHWDRLQIQNHESAWDVRSFTPRDYPGQWTQGQMTQALGQLFNDRLQMPCPFILQFQGRALNAESSLSRIQLRAMRHDQAVRSPAAKFQPSLQHTHDELNWVRQYLDSGGRLIHGGFQVTAWAPPGEAPAAERRIRDLFRANGWQLAKPLGLQWPYYMALWPMMMSEGLYDDFDQLQQWRTHTAHSAVNQLPLQGEWQGSRRPYLLLPGRRGEPAGWNPFENEGNYNVAVAAASGKGKSTLVQEYITALVGAGGRVWVIDVGRSYEKTCRLLGGEYIEFIPDAPLSLNPFTTVDRLDEALALLKPLFATMARPHSTISDEEASDLEQALRAAWAEAGRDAEVDTVARWLADQPEPRAQNLAHLLYPYTRAGMHGAYFNGPCDLDLSNPFVVLELEELKGKPDLQQLVLYALMVQISDRMYRGGRDQHKACIIDEAWDLMSGDNAAAARFIETGYRRSRRYNGQFITITQSINDYFANAAAQTAYDNSDWMLLLGQRETAIDQLRQSERFPLDGYTERLLKSLQTTADYAECCIKGPAGLTVHRVVLDPYSRILYSSKGNDVEAVQTLQHQGYTLQDAVARVAEARYGD
jgi:conjugal transfer ATP-binding protein TraC